MSDSRVQNEHVNSQRAGAARPVNRTQAMLRARCPRCRSGAIFTAGGRLRWPRMFPYCPDCGLKYERESGYFLGAMYISYGFALALIAVFAAIIWSLSSFGFYGSVLIGLLLFIPFAPLIAIFARVAWIHFDRTVDPERD